MEIFHAIEQGFQARRAAGDFDRALARWRGRCAAFEAIGTFDELIEIFRGENREHVERDPLLVGLCAAAAGEAERDQLAGLLLCWLFLPGLWNALREFASLDSAEADDVAAELLAGFLARAERVQPGATYVGHRLVTAARKRASRFIRRSARWRGRVVLLDEARSASGAPRPDDYDDSLRQALRRGIVTRHDLELLILGDDEESLRRVAEDQGLSLVAAYHRRSRARKRLGEWLTASLHDGAAE